MARGKILILLICTSVLGCAPSKPIDPTVGTWVVPGKKTLTLNPDGTLKYNWRAISTGTFSWKTDRVIEIKYTTHLGHRGGFVAGDPRATSVTSTTTATMSEDKATLEFDGEIFRRK